MRLWVKIRLLVILLGVSVLSLFLVSGLPVGNNPLYIVAAQAITCPGPTNAPNSAQENLDESEDDWGVYCENNPQWRMQNVATPSADGESLECAITGGDPYSNVHCYRNLVSEPDAAMFTLDMAFWFTSTTCNNVGGESVVQALEFTMNKWYQQQRYEFAIQWQNVGVGGPQWRYWDPTQPADQRWVAFSPSIGQCLQGGNNKKHTLRMEGAIVSGQVELRNFTIDGETHNVNLIIPAISDVTAPDVLAVAVQVDGNAAQTPYSLFIDQVHFIRWSNLLTPLSPVNGAVSPTQKPTLTWNAVADAVRYEVQLDRVNPPAVTVASSNTLSYMPSVSLLPTTYYWRVRAINAAGHASPWTPSQCLMVQSDTVKQNFFTTRTPTLTWNRLSWAAEYEIQVDDSSSLAAPLEYTAVVPASVLAVTTSSLRDCAHYWRVRGRATSSEWGIWSAINTFAIDAP